MKSIVIALALVCAGTFAQAAEGTGEKVDAKMNDAKRAAKKAGHSVQEATCMKGDAKCAAQKAGNTMKEGGEAVKDKAKEGVNKVD